MKHEALFVGLTTIDIQYFVEEIPRSNTKIKTEIPDILVGGPATNAAVAFAYLNKTATLASPVGLNAFSTFIDQDLNIKSEFEFKIKFNKDSKDQCIEFQEDNIIYSSYELIGDINTDPIPTMLGQLDQDIGEIIQGSVSKAVYNFLSGSNRDKNIYCDAEYNKTYEDNYPCRCD